MVRVKLITTTYVLAVNALAYITMVHDKYQAKKKDVRVAEYKFFILAFLLGALGIYLGMNAPINHKSAKSKFKVGIPLILILNVVVVYFLLKLNFSF